MWWFSKIPWHFPFAEGKLIPASADIMTDYVKDGIFVRVYYPSDLGGNIEDYYKQWVPWVPRNSYIYGFSKVVMVWKFIIRIVLWFYSGTAYIPAVCDAKPLSSRKMKCIIMSHGLGATRFMYSAICTDLASRGFFVAVLEHRDDSSCSTYYYESEESVRKDKRTFIDHVRVEFDDRHYAVRNEQVNKRSAECIKVINMLFDINNGKPPKNILEDLPSDKSTKLDLQCLKNALDLSDITIMGHSFGGATSILTLANDKRLKQGVLLDPWMFPIKEMKEVEDVSQPLLFINTQTFHIASNVNAMEKYLLQPNLKRYMYTILHTTHENQCDTPYTTGYWLNWFMKKLSPAMATKINNCLILRFLNSQIGYPDNIEDCEKYLKTQAHNIIEGLTKPWV